MDENLGGSRDFQFRDNISGLYKLEIITPEPIGTSNRTQPPEDGRLELI
jgi:hypothetical protein